MKRESLEARVRRVKGLAHGRWNPILSALGVPESIVRKRNLPCPVCGQGQDRFQYTDKYGDGNYHCRKCGPGDGFTLLEALFQWSFTEALANVERCIGAASSAPDAGVADTNRLKHLVFKLWNEACPVSRGDEVDRYLRNRGIELDAYPDTLRFHPALGYFERDAAGTSQKIADYPAMLGCIQDADGAVVSLHRTYLDDGHQLMGRESKKILCTGYKGGAIRLYSPTDCLALAEGIETALAVHLATDCPVWSALNAGNLERVWIPNTVRRVFIFGDNDSAASFDGQASAYALARRLKAAMSPQAPIEIKVFIPRQAGCDWADAWLTHEKQSQFAV